MTLKFGDLRNPSVLIFACKMFMNVSKGAFNDATLSDLGRYPMHIFAAKRTVKYWIRLLSLPKDRYIRLCYVMLKRSDSIGYSNWVSDIRNNLYENGYGYV